MEHDKPSTRRVILRRGLTAAAALTAAAGLTAQRAEAKVAQKAVQYVEVSKKPNQNCGDCANFIAPNQCKVVEGNVAPTGWCLVWAQAKKS